MGLWFVIWLVTVQITTLNLKIRCYVVFNKFKRNRYEDFASNSSNENTFSKIEVKQNRSERYLIPNITEDNNAIKHVISLGRAGSHKIHSGDDKKPSTFNRNRVDFQDALLAPETPYIHHTSSLAQGNIRPPEIIHKSTHIIYPSLPKKHQKQNHDMQEKQNITQYEMHVTKLRNSLSTQNGDQILRSFMRPFEMSDQQLSIAKYLTNKIQEQNTSTQAVYPLQTENSKNSQLDSVHDKATSDVQKISEPYVTVSPVLDAGHQNNLIEDSKPRPSIVSFFKEESTRDEENESFFENSFMNGLNSLDDNVPIISKLIKGTLDQDIEKENDAIRKEEIEHVKTNAQKDEGVSVDYDLMVDNYNSEHGHESLSSTKNATSTFIPKHINLSTTSTGNAKRNRSDIIEHNSKNGTVNLKLLNLVKTFDRITNHNQTNVTKPQDLINENKIIFFRIKSAKPLGVCMDGSPPGYYLRRGLGAGENKWIIHLHGGAWCYDLHSCLKRRKSILGSTERSNKADIRSFFHGLLSRSSKVNPKFYNWNVAVLSYCDGGLFSGNRKRSVTGKGIEFHFQGRNILQSLLEDLLDQRHLAQATDVVLSGTSAGGLALALQGDFIQTYLPKNAKVRGLIDAALFLDRKSINGVQLARQQFKALYSLHRPILNAKCLNTVARKDRYLCLFPEKSLRYLQLPVFIVNSLYDHWQLSYLNSIDCVYDEKRCDTKQRDDILTFRNHMFRTLEDIKHYKNNTGVFANSCFAHGQAILDYTWTNVKVFHKNIESLFSEWYDNDKLSDSQSSFYADCKYPCNGSCPRFLAQKCVANFKGASEHRRRRDAELC